MRILQHHGNGYSYCSYSKGMIASSEFRRFTNTAIALLGIKKNYC